MATPDSSKYFKDLLAPAYTPLSKEAFLKKYLPALAVKITPRYGIRTVKKGAQVRVVDTGKPSAVKGAQTARDNRAQAHYEHYLLLCRQMGHTVTSL